YPAKSLIYLPTASYDKMEEWVLPTKERKIFEKIRKELKEDPKKRQEYLFLKGGFWRYYLVKYPESNNMHKKMLHVREKLIQIEKQANQFVDEERKQHFLVNITEAWNEIYKSQCNDSYWHGLFGGVYLQFLRFSVYAHLINAEKIIDQLNANLNSEENKYVSITLLDFNKNSRMDVIIESGLLNLYINPSDGGTIFELDYKPKSYNLLNTLTRWPEAYHDNEDNDEEEIMVDRYKRSMFRLRFIHKDSLLKLLESDRYKEHASFIDGVFKVVRSKKDKTTAIVELEMDSHIKGPNSNEMYPCNIRKSIVVEESQVILKVNCKFEKVLGKEELLKDILESLYLGVDLPFFFNGDPDKFQWKINQEDSLNKRSDPLLKPLEFIGQKFKAYDESYDLNLEISFNDVSKTTLNPKKISKFPIIAYAFTDEGYKEIYQGINILPQFELKNDFEYIMKIKIS
ncbi:MAG: DUF1925 domain-containing protein, partial [Candidatus Lokiarchaeota archaeon]|nr:DUF1925 domain-containing protein [Candidatus Lokiarchaeota archaeon]